MRSFQIIIILIGALGWAGCTTVKQGGKAPNERIYQTDLLTTIEEVVDAFSRLKLNLEEEGWAVQDERYEIVGYEMDRVFRTSDGIVRSANVLVVVESIDSGQTRVTMETTRRDRPSMASSAGSTVNHERTFFKHLDKILPIALPENQSAEASQP